MSPLIHGPMDKMNRQMLLLAMLLVAFLAHTESVARSVDIRILHASNISAQIEPIAFGRSQGKGGLGGLYDIVSELRGLDPNLILTTSGSTFFGSPESDVLSGKPIIAALNKLGWNFVSPSNADFSAGIDVLDKFGEDFSGELLGANLRNLGGRKSFNNIDPYVVEDIEGVRVAFVGMTAPQLPLHYHQSFLQGIEVRCVLESLKQSVSQVRQHDPHLVVLMLDLSLADDHAPRVLLEAVATTFPEIDIALGAGYLRQHAALEIGDLVYTQSKDRAESVILIEINYDTVLNSITSIDSREVDVQPAAESELASYENISSLLDQSRDLLRGALGIAPSRLPAMSHDNEESVTALLLQALSKSADADIAFISRQNNQVVYPRSVYERDIWRLLPMEDRIVVMSLNLESIRMILNANVQHLGRNIFLSSLGLCYSVTEGDDGHRHVGDIRLSNGDNIHPRRRLRVAFSSGAVASAGGCFPVIRDLAARPESHASIMDTSTRDALRSYILSTEKLPDNLGRGVIQHLNMD